MQKLILHEQRVFSPKSCDCLADMLKRTFSTSLGFFTSSQRDLFNIHMKQSKHLGIRKHLIQAGRFKSDTGWERGHKRGPSWIQQAPWVKFQTTLPHLPTLSNTHSSRVLSLITLCKHKQALSHQTSCFEKPPKCLYCGVGALIMSGIQPLRLS